MPLLFVAAHHQEDLQNRASIGRQIPFEPVDLVIPGMPHLLGIGAVDMRHDDILIMRAIEHRDPPVLRQLAPDAPQEVVLQLLLAGFAESVVVDAHRVALAEHMAHDAALAGGIHALQHDEQPTPYALDAVGIQQFLEACDLAGADVDEPFAVLAVAFESGGVRGVDPVHAHTFVEHEPLRRRQRPHHAQQVAGFGGAGHAFGERAAVVDAADAVERRIQRPVDETPVASLLAFLAVPDVFGVLAVLAHRTSLSVSPPAAESTGV